MSFKRIRAMIIKDLMYLSVSLEELVDTFFWPFIDLIIWGIITSFLLKEQAGSLTIMKYLMGGLVLWNIVWRTQQDISVGTLRNVWSVIFVSLFSTPLTIVEYLVSLMILGVIKIFMTMALVSFFAFILYSFNIFQLGLLLVPMFLLLLVFGWAIGILITGFIVRYGARIQVLAWSLVALLNPVCCVFYPLSALPKFMQKIAVLFPPTYIFEGMRSVFKNGVFPIQYFIYGAVLDLVWLVIGVAVFYYFFEKARETGRLAKIEE